MRLQALRAIESTERFVKGRKRQMASLASYLQHEAIGEAERWLCAKALKSSGNHVRVLNREAAVIQKHFYRNGYLRC